jgi:hypothetical protein
VIQERATYASIHGHHAEAAREAERAIEIGRSAGLREMQVKANGVLGAAIAFAQLELDEPDPGALRHARDLFVEGVEWAVGEGTGLEQAVATANLAWFLNLTGEYTEALRTTQDALRLTLSEHFPKMSPSELLLEIAALAARVGDARQCAVLAGFPDPPWSGTAFACTRSTSAAGPTPSCWRAQYSARRPTRRLSRKDVC